jgi:polyphosphate kinase 2 (PPK2 family)
MTIVKFFLAIDKDTQRERLQERIDDPTKSWKFKLGDVAERKLWDGYQAAFEDMLLETSTDYAPWYAIPANRNWFRNLAVSEILVDILDELNPQYPQPAAGIKGLKIV